jgi:hypothetical protein
MPTLSIEPIALILSCYSAATRRNAAVFVDELDASRFPDYSAAWGS